MNEKYYIELMEKYLTGTISGAEMSELSMWLEHDDKLNKWWAEELAEENRKLNQEKGSVDVDLQNELLDKLKNRIQKPEKSRTISSEGNKILSKIYLNVLKWTAIICLPVVLSLTVYMFLRSERYESPLIVQTKNGNRTEMTLPDGTNVKLNSASQLSYSGNYGIKERLVRLTGEAFFNVIHDVKHPFIVETGELQVVVLGTSFNVSSYEDHEDVSIVLLEGKVNVCVNSRQYLMNPNDKIIYNKRTQKISAARVYSKDYIEWTKGGLYFDNETLENIVKTLERTYNIRIQFVTEELKKERFSGTLGNGGIQSVLEKLTMAFPFTYEFRDSVIILKTIK